MSNRFDEIKGRLSGGKLRVIDWPKPRVSNPNLLREEFERYERELEERKSRSNREAPHE